MVDGSKSKQKKRKKCFLPFKCSYLQLKSDPINAILISFLVFYTSMCNAANDF